MTVLPSTKRKTRLLVLLLFPMAFIFALTSFNNVDDRRYQNQAMTNDFGRYSSQATKNLSIADLKLKFKNTPTENRNECIRVYFQIHKMETDLQAVTPCNCSSKQSIESKEKDVKDMKVKAETHCMTKKFPKAILIGMTKGGTSALMTFLKFHPFIASRADIPRDTRYFNHYFKERSIDWYRNIMPCSFPNQITISKSTEYFFTPGVAEKIRKFDPTMKIIVMVREPISRAVSQYVMWQYLAKYRIGNTSLDDAITTGSEKEIDKDSRLIVVSNYQRHMKAWLANFSLKQILIIDSSNFVKNPAEELNKLEDFLGVKRYFTQDKFVYNATKHKYCLSLEDGDINCLEATKGLPHPVIEKDLRLKLEKFFKPRNHMFFKMVNRTFDWGY